MMKSLALLFTPLVTSVAIQIAPAEDHKVDLDPLVLRWTFGNHEPIAMYRRIGGPSTGGIDGSAEWLERWHRWFDSEASTKVMEDLGLNILHCRFYKGFGWQHEVGDFPNVKQFVGHCHAHGIKALAYVQFSTLYYEVMQSEIPDLADWAAVDQQGQKLTYHGGGYFRWLPCINAPGFEPYLTKMIRIALEEGDFDGIMFDNCFMPPCYCPRCQALFREYLAREPEPKRRFGLPSVEHVELPPTTSYGELRDPIAQRWLEFRCRRLEALFRRLYLAGKAVKPSAIMAGNVAAIRRWNMAGSAALSITDLNDCFDLFVSQSGNEPGARDGSIINRVREMKLAQALGTDILALSDADAGISPEAEAKVVLNLLENAVFGGIPTDRTVLRADREMVSPRLVASRKPLLERFNKAVRDGREGLARPTYQPVYVLYSRESIMFSEASYRAILAAEEILLRNHIPYALLPTAALADDDSGSTLAIPDDCKVLLVCDQRCLGDAALEAIGQYAQRGGRLVVTGRSGDYDAWYAERDINPLGALAELPGVVCRREVDTAKVRRASWTIEISPPDEGGRRLTDDLAKLWSRPLRITAPPTVFVEVKRDAKRVSIHLLNYDRQPVAKGIRIAWDPAWAGADGATFAAPMDGRQAAPIAAEQNESDGWFVELPKLVDYAVVELPAAQ